MSKLLRTKYNDYNTDDLPIVYYQDVKMMSDDERNDVAEKIRLKLLEKWEKNGQPLGGGKKTDERIVKDFRELMKYNDDSTLISGYDDKDVEKKEFSNVLKFFGKQPSGINQYFPEMLDTPISIGSKPSSVMDVIRDTKKFQDFFFSIVWKDRMYSFTQWYGWSNNENENVGKPIEDMIPNRVMELLGDKVPYEYSDLKNKEMKNRFHGYKLPFYFKKDDKYYKLNKEESDFKKGLNDGFVPAKYSECSYKEYESNMKIFPNITQSFRLGGGSQPVSNFSAGIARFLIREGFKNALEKELIKNDTFVVLDPSTGWAGRMVGLLSIHTELRKIYKEKTGNELTIVYLTTDPNKTIDSRYNDILNDWFEVIEPLADRKYFHMFKDDTGSETIEFLNFCKTKLSEFGLVGVSMGLTSPPYFNRERYSDDENQSCVKYGSSYKIWSEGFLKPTIKNISELLLKDGIFYMNIANISYNGKDLPLQDDTKRYANEYNCSCNDNLYKMLMSTMTGNNKDSKATGRESKNSVVIKDGSKETKRKFEPIFILVGGQKETIKQNPLQVPEGMFPGSKPMDGEELKILNKTAKRLISDKPTTLSEKKVEEKIVESKLSQDDIDDFLNSDKTIDVKKPVVKNPDINQTFFDKILEKKEENDKKFIMMVDNIDNSVKPTTKQSDSDEDDDDWFEKLG